VQRTWTTSIAILALFGAASLGVLWVVTQPAPLAQSALPQHRADLANGEVMFNIGGCRSCHRPGPGLKDADPSLPAGGAPLKTPVGIFYPPNLTPDAATGIGTMTDLEFVNAVQRGLSPAGAHLAPAFPYTSYARMKIEDVLDIKAYLVSLKPVTSATVDAEIPVAPLFRRGIGLWKILGFSPEPWQADASRSAVWNRGAYLVNGPGHCGECHTPRNALMVSLTDQAFAGGAHPGGEGKVPSLQDLVGRGRYKDAKDLAAALQFGEVMGYDKLSSGGMGEVQTNISKLPEADINAIADYLVSLK
jgi:mono/diheme cytochrome c family protein